MENWNQVAKYEQISANSYGTAIEKMEAYTSGVEAAQKRLTASMEKLALWFNNFGVLEGLYNTAATLVDNMAIFSAALLASAIALDKGMAFTLLGNGVGKLTSILGNVGAMFSGIGNLGADKNYFKNLLGLNFAEGSATSLSVVREMYSSALGRATVALTADEKAIYDNIQSTLLSTSADTRKTLASHMLTNSLTENDISLLENTQLEQLLTAATGETVDVRKTRLAAEADYTQALRREATSLLNNSGKAQGAMQVMRTNLNDSTTRTGASLAASGIGNIVGMFAGGWSGGAIGNLIGGASGQTIGTMLNSILGGKAGGNLIGGFTSLKGYRNKKNKIDIEADKIFDTTYKTVFAQKQQELREYASLLIGDTGAFIDEGSIISQAQEAASNAAEQAAIAFTQSSKQNLKGSILKAFGGPIGLASIGLQIGMAVWSAYLKAQDEALKHAQEKFKEANDKYAEALNASIKTDKYDKLAQGVDYLGRNISLTDEEYQEFLTLSNELANVFPDLVVRVDDAGNKFIGMGNSVSGVTEKVNELVSALKQDVDISIFEKSSRWLGLIQESVFGDAVEKANTEYQKAYDKLYGNETEMGLRNGGIYRDIQILEAQLGTSEGEEYTKITQEIEKLKKEAKSYEDIIKTANDELVGYIPSLVQYAKSIDGISLGYSGLASQQAALTEESRSVINALSGEAVSKISGVSGDEFMALALENIQKITDLVESNPILVDIYYRTNSASTMAEADKAKENVLESLKVAFGADGFDEQEKQVLISLGFKFDENGNLTVDTAVDRIKQAIKSAFNLDEGTVIDLSNSTEFINGLTQQEYGILNSMIAQGWIGEDALNNHQNEVRNLIGSGYQAQDKDTLKSLSEYYRSNIQKNIDDIDEFYRSIAMGQEELTRENVALHFSEYSNEARESIYQTALEFEKLREGTDNQIQLYDAYIDKLAEVKASGQDVSQALSPYVESLKAFAQVSLKDAFGDLELDGIADTWEELFNVMEAINDTYNELQGAREEQNTAGKLSVQTVLGLLSANENYAAALEVVNGQIQLKANAEEIMAKVQLQALEATLEAAIAEKEMQKAQLQSEYLRLQAGETEIEVSDEEIDANSAKIDSLNALAKAYANTAQWAMYLAENEKLVAMDPNSAEYATQESKVAGLLKQAQSGSYASKVQEVTAPKKPTLKYDDEGAVQIRLKQIEEQLGRYDEDTRTFSGGSLDESIELQRTLLNEVRQTIGAGGSFEAWEAWYPKPEDIKDSTDATKDLLDALDALIDKEYEEMKAWDSVTQTKLGDSQYYGKKRASLENLRQYWTNKYNSSSGQLEKLEAEKELMQIDIELANLDDEEREQALEIAKLKGATVEEQITLTEKIRDTSDSELEYLQRVQDVNEAQKQRVELLKAQKELINKEYYEIYQSVLGINNVSAAYFENITRNIEKQIEELENYLNTAQNLSEIDTLNVQAEIQNLYVELANVDDQMMDDALSFLKNIGASQGALIAQYQERIATADTEQERIQYEHDLNEAILERMKLEKEFFEFEKKVMDYEMEYFEGLPESDNYKKQLDKMIQNTKDTLAKTKEILQQAYNNIYEDTVHGYQNVIDANGNRVYSDSDIQKMIDDGTIDAEVQQNKEYQDAMIDYIEAQQALGDLMMEDFNNQIDAIERRIKELETSKPVQWGTEWDEENKKIIRKATDRIKTYYNKLEEYYKQEAASAFKTLEEQASILTDAQIEELVAKYNDAMKQIRDNEVQLREDIKDYQESVYSALVNEVGRYKDQLEKQKELVSKYYDEELEKLQDKEQSIARTNNLIELQNRLLSAQQEKERVYREGKKSALYKENYIG